VLEIGFLGTSSAIFLATNALFYKSDDYFSKDFKEDVSLRLLCIGEKNNNRLWPSHFVKLFDFIFLKKEYLSSGYKVKNYISFTTFIKSCFASFIGFLILILIGATVGPEEFKNSLINGSYVDFVWFFIFGAFINLIPDYFSLIQTRTIIELFKQSDSLIKSFGYIFLDLMLTILIFILGYSIFLIIGAIYFEFDINITSGFSVYEKWKEISWVGNGGFNLLGLYFYTSFFTSLWLWVYGLSNMLFYIFSKTDKPIEIIKYILPIEDKPFRSIGICCSFILMLFYLLIALVGSISQSTT